MEAKLLDNYRLLGYKLTKVRFGNVIGNRPDGTPVFMSGEGNIIDRDFECVRLLADGVYAIDKDGNTDILNNGEHVLQLSEEYNDRPGTDILYLLGYYVYIDHEEGRIEAYNSTGYLIVRLEWASFVNYSTNGDQLHICVEDVSSRVKRYTVLSINTATDKYESYTFSKKTVPFTFVDDKSTIYRVDLIGENCVIIIYKNNTVLFNMDTHRYTEIKDMTCKRLPIYDYGYNTVSSLERKNYIARDVNTNEYYLLDGEGKTKFVSSTNEPTQCYYDYYTMEVGTKICIIDSNSGRRSSLYDKVSVFTDKKAIGRLDDKIFVIKLETMEEEYANIDNVSRYEVDIRSALIFLQIGEDWHVYTSDLEYLCTEQEYTKFMCN